MLRVSRAVQHLNYPQYCLLNYRLGLLHPNNKNTCETVKLTDVAFYRFHVNEGKINTIVFNEPATSTDLQITHNSNEIGQKIQCQGGRQRCPRAINRHVKSIKSFFLLEFNKFVCLITAWYRIVLEIWFKSERASQKSINKLSKKINVNENQVQLRFKLRSCIALVRIGKVFM